MQYGNYSSVCNGNVLRSQLHKHAETQLCRIIRVNFTQSHIVQCCSVLKNAFIERTLNNTRNASENFLAQQLLQNSNAVHAGNTMRNFSTTFTTCDRHRVMLVYTQYVRTTISASVLPLSHWKPLSRSWTTTNGTDAHCSIPSRTPGSGWQIWTMLFAMFRKSHVHMVNFAKNRTPSQWRSTT